MPKIRGVNLGGWLVLEPWIRPSLFAQWATTGSEPGYDGAPVDQWTYCATLGPDEALRRLTAHWDSWVTEADVAELAAAGLTHVRVPVPHWMLGNIAADEPYVHGEWPYLARLCGWARAAGLEVWLDLHTAPGSQNGYDNSGHAGYPIWDMGNNTARTVQIAGDIAAAVAAAGLDDVVTGFGLLNEPAKWLPKEKHAQVLGYYDDAAAAVRAVLPDAAIYISDIVDLYAQPVKFASFWRDADHGPGGATYLETHPYVVFNAETRRLTPRAYVRQMCELERAQLARCCFDDASGAPTALRRVVGEWTAATDQDPRELFPLVMRSLAPGGDGTAAMFPSSARRPRGAARDALVRDFSLAQVIHDDVSHTNLVS